MSTLYPANSIWPVSCEKSSLFRHGVLCPKIECSPVAHPKMSQSVTSLVPITEMCQLKTDISGPDLLFLYNKKWQSRN